MGNLLTCHASNPRRIHCGGAFQPALQHAWSNLAFHSLAMGTRVLVHSGTNYVGGSFAQSDTHRSIKRHSNDRKNPTKQIDRCAIMKINYSFIVGKIDRVDLVYSLSSCR